MGIRYWDHVLRDQGIRGAWFGGLDIQGSGITGSLFGGLGNGGSGDQVLGYQILGLLTHNKICLYILAKLELK